jgi:primosomal replication protein N''
MIRFCPNCKTERPLFELFCEGTYSGERCNWTLSDEPIRQEGWRPEAIVTAADHASTQPSRSAVCANGHSMDESDFMCLDCGAQRGAVGTNPLVVPTEPTSPDLGEQETIVDGWRLMRLLGATPRVRDRYEAHQVASGQVGVLTLYHHGAEPDTAVYEVLNRLPRDHVPEIYATGRWDDRAYEVTEYLSGGSLADIGVVAADLESVRRIVFELSKALQAFSEVGLRHRDLRPSTLLVRNRDPLDLVITGFGSARLSEFDLDIVSPLEVTRYMAPEAIAGGVAAASDWWSLGMVLLEQITKGKCFEGINERAFLINVLASGVNIPSDLGSELDLLFRGLLARDRHQRWQGPQVQAWLAGDPVAAPPRTVAGVEDLSVPAIKLGTRSYRQPALFALAAAEPENWSEARDHLLRGVLMTWAQEVKLDAKVLAGIRRVAQQEVVPEDFRLMLALKLLNPEMPLIYQGDIVTPRWLLDHPLEGYELVSGVVPDLLDELGTENWLSRLKARDETVRAKAKLLDIELDEDTLRIYVLSSSRAKLAAEWEERRRVFPDSINRGVQALMERSTIGEGDLIVLLSAAIGLFRSVDDVVEEASKLAATHGVSTFDAAAARQQTAMPRLELLKAVNERIAGFARCGKPALDEWADHFRVERRLSIARSLVLLAVSTWQEPQRQQYISQILEFFEKRISASVMRGPLVRMTIGKATARVDLGELGTPRVSSVGILEHLLQRGQQPVDIDPAAFAVPGTTEARLQSLSRQSALYKRDTGIDGLYLGFPFLLAREARASVKTRIAPLLLWPVRIHMEVGNRGQVGLSFDNDREEVRLNPAIEGILGIEAAKQWRRVADELLGRSALQIAEIADAFGVLAPPRNRSLRALPGAGTELPLRTQAIDCSAALFHVTFSGQAIGEDLRNLKALSPAGTGLESALRLLPAKKTPDTVPPPPREIDRFFTVSSDPSQEAAVLQARHAPGLLVEGPPGTGKSQTIVNMVGDAIGRRQSMLIVCQKHAALEVVHKRLVAEGLGDRVVMLNDVNKDRAPVIKAVRAQLDIVHGRASDPCIPIRRKREEIAARIESLEGDLDRHHLALHRTDERIGLSYRSLLGELINLESDAPPLDLPALRATLQKLTTGELASLEEEMAPLARLWFPAKYEGSALGQLQEFAPDRATLVDFQEAFVAFEEAERVRSEVLLSRPAEFEVEDPAPHRTWLSAYGHQFLNLKDQTRLLLTRWLPLFRPISAERDSSGNKVLAHLLKIARALQAAPHSQYDKLLSPVLAALDSKALAALIETTNEQLAPASWLQKLSPGRYMRGRGVRAFLRDHADTPAPARMTALKEAADLETTWRPLRGALAKAHVTLHLPKVSADAGPTLAKEAAASANAFKEIAGLADALAAAPWSDKTDAAAAAGTKEAFLKLFATFDSAFARFEVRQASHASLASLGSWLSAEWQQRCSKAIAANEPNQSRLQPIRDALPTVAPFQSFRGRARRLSQGALAAFSLFRSKETQLAAIPLSGLDQEFRRVLAREARLGWKRAMEQAEPDLQLERSEIESKVASLAGLDKEMRGLNAQLLRNDFDVANIRRTPEWEDITRLTGARARRLREFVELGAGLGLMKLRPIWLMNPDVASRVLPLNASFFDSVIYDEASQMPVEHALPTLFRGRISIVSGDEKQMPPTAFFASKIESDEAESFDGEEPDQEASEEERDAYDETWNRREIKDCPDLLQLARTNLPNRSLQIHYRSAYRELIGFSNACFYGNALSVPVRHPLATIRAVRPIEVISTNSVYQDQTNPGEAAKVVEVLAEFWQRPYGERPSIGVVTFNRKQADLIEEHLELRAESDPVFREAYRLESERMENGEDMGVFVKNVENVQGDERDVIVFSSTFGRNSQGTFRRAFGVLGQKGGERRLNVAVTRARKKIVMVTSMPVGDISDVLTTHRPPSTPRDFLQGYMEYARSLSAGEFDTSDALLARMTVRRDGRTGSLRGKVDDGFGLSVASYVNSLGRILTSSTEDDAFGLDFAIEDPATGLFAIGIECDAPRHELLTNARAREVWRPSVLGRAVPWIHRVSSHAWYHDPVAERERLRAAIASVMSTDVVEENVGAA